MESRIVSEIPGPKSRNIRSREDQYLASGHQSFALMAGIVVDAAKGSEIWDIDGNRYVDIIGGIGVNGLGHSHPRFIRALEAQLKKISVGSFTSEARVGLLEKLSAHAPAPGVNQVQLYSGGAEAVESALRLAKSFTKKFEFVGFWGGFHGKTMGALSLMGSEFKYELGPLVSGNYLVPYANCYRCPLKMQYPSCGLACVEFAREHLRQNTTGKVAAFLIEPMQGTAGNVIPPDDYLPAIKDLAKEFDALLIVDEMITGFGRTGKFWGVEHSGVEPDVVTIGKQFGGGFPISGVLSRRNITTSSPWSRPSGSSSSYGGNPLAAAAAFETLKIIEDEQLVENAKIMGHYFLNKLKVFEERFSFVGNVNGKGLLIGVELVRNKKTKEPLSKDILDFMFEQCLRRGLLTMIYSPHFRIQTAMTIKTEIIDEAVGILDEVFTLTEKKALMSKSI